MVWCETSAKGGVQHMLLWQYWPDCCMDRRVVESLIGLVRHLVKVWGAMPDCCGNVDRVATWTVVLWSPWCGLSGPVVQW